MTTRRDAFAYLAVGGIAGLLLLAATACSDSPGDDSTAAANGGDRAPGTGAPTAGTTTPSTTGPSESGEPGGTSFATNYEFPASPAATSSATLQAVPTYNNIGLYFQPTEGSTARTALVRYRPRGTTNWARAHDMWFDDRDLASKGQAARSKEYRSSIVQVGDGKAYDVEVFLTDVNHIARATVSTWSNSHKVFKEVLVNASNQTLVITEGGNANDGYIVYKAASPGATIDVANAEPHAVDIKASHVILRGLTIKGAQSHAVLLRPGSSDVVIDGNDISQWGRQAADGWGIDWEGGIAGENVTDQKLARITVQNNKIHHPRWDTNTWKEYRSDQGGYHPEGPIPMFFQRSRGQFVIRGNRMETDDDHYFNDCISGGPNFGFDSGNLGPDSDVYNNFCQRSWDDGLEIEGANINVRVYKNFTDRTLTGIALSAVTVGPIYVFRNVTHRYQETPSDPWTNAGGGFVKSQSRTTTGALGGRVYLYHNTLVTDATGGGSSQGIDGLGFPISNITSRNNVLIGLNVITDYGTWDGKTDLDNDLYSGRISSPSASRWETKGIEATPVFDLTLGIERPMLMKGTPGHDQALAIPGFNDIVGGAGPDMGAYERAD